MISEDIIRLVVSTIRKQAADGKPLNFAGVKGTIFKKYGEHYSEGILKKLWEAEKDNSKYKPKESPKPYVDLKKL